MRFQRLLVFVLPALFAACGSDDESDCAEGQLKRNVCTACGLAGGCSKQAAVCTTQCADNVDCPTSPYGWCIDGLCQVGGCI
jgi:hypothetical protein